MNPETLAKAISEAERFLRIASEVEVFHGLYENGKPHHYLESPTKENAACKRASLDLTRALAQMRRYL